eukprot:gene7080-7827_t
MPSVDLAKRFFKEYVLPRRVRDIVAEQKYLSTHDHPRPIYRRVGLDEDDRGQLYPVLTSGFQTFAHFGIGVGIYFTQLLFLTTITFMGGMIMILATNTFRQSDYNKDDPNREEYSTTAACDSYVNVTATVGCDHNATSCLAEYAYNCDLPYLSAVGDLVMSVFIAAAVFLSAFLEKRMQRDLDEAVQTASDYSVEVKDPPRDADNFDEWQEYFSRFGPVRYITIVRKNEGLLQAVLRLHKHSQKIITLEEKVDQHHRIHYHKEQVEKYSRLVDELSRKSYPVCRVYASFEHEEHQRLCIKETEVPDIYAMLDIRPTWYRDRSVFRSTSILNIIEPPEPDNVIWRNLGISWRRRFVRRIYSVLGTMALYVLTYYIVEYTRQISPGFLAVVIGVIDSLLPYGFQCLVDISLPVSEGLRQSSLQLRLFAGRFLLSTILPYVQSQWNKVLTPYFIRQIIVIQVSACFTAPLVALLDIPGRVNQFFFSRFADTQEEMNWTWSGTEWSLAEKYTGISKVIVVSLFYTLLVPYSLFLCVPAFLLYFMVDRYLLLRRWKRMPMLDQKVALRLRQQAILAVAAHMYISMRFIYSWPMDQAYDNDGVFEKVNKYPYFGAWSLNLQYWQSTGQKRIFYAYKICLLITVIISGIVWLAIPGYRKLRKLMCTVVEVVGSSQGIPFSKLTNVDIYEPILVDTERSYRCAYCIDVQPNHRAEILVASPNDPIDLSYHVSPQQQPFVLSVVKYFSDQASAKVSSLVNMIDSKSKSKLEEGHPTSPRYEVIVQNDAEDQAAPLATAAPPPPPIPVDLYEKIRGKTVERDLSNTKDSIMDQPLGILNQRLRGLQQDQDDVLLKKEFVRPREVQRSTFGNKKVLPALTPTPSVKHNNRYANVDSQDLDRMV